MAARNHDFSFSNLGRVSIPPPTKSTVAVLRYLPSLRAGKVQRWMLFDAGTSRFTRVPICSREQLRRLLHSE